MASKAASKLISVDFQISSHNLAKDILPKLTATANGEELIQWQESMFTIRRMELEAEKLYKQRHIGGFCHLYDGQEGIAVGFEAALTLEDKIINAYRCHAHQFLREGSVRKIIAELIGKSTGSTHGIGGSMHLYRSDKNFYGGNGIVGAQTALGSGLALSLKYKNKVLNEPNSNVTIALYGDGAANQGQFYEAMNMSKLWNLPIIYVCENNKYGMGTAVSRASANTNFYARGDYVPGVRFDGMNAIICRHIMQWAKKFSAENGPLILEADTYRYKGHSMSDPGTTYRTRDEVKSVRTKRDPITHLEDLLIEHKILTADQIKEKNATVKSFVEAEVKQAMEDPFPEPFNLYENIYVEKTTPRPVNFSP